MPQITNRAFGNSQFLIVEEDAEGKVRVVPIDGTNGLPFREGWIIDKPYDPDSFVYTDEGYQRTTNPVFPDNAMFECNYNDGKLTVKVPQATDDGERVAGYYFTVKDKDGIVERRFGMSSGYYLYEIPEFETYTVDFDGKPGEYFVECYAQSFFDKKSSKIFTTFKV